VRGVSALCRPKAAQDSLESNNAIRFYFVKGYPTDGAEDLLLANGRDLSVPHSIVAFVTWADGAHVISPLVDVTDRFQRGIA
jgi:hypothetical protein